MSSLAILFVYVQPRKVRVYVKSWGEALITGGDLNGEFTVYVNTHTTDPGVP